MSTALSLASAFNLICAGTLTTDDWQGQVKTRYRVEYRVDLEAGLWCEGVCDQSAKVYFANDTELVLRHVRATGAGREANTVNRLTGLHSAFSHGVGERGAILKQWEGKCEPAPFTGVPPLAQKF